MPRWAPTGRTLLLGFGLFALGACEAGYYAHLVRGQGEILLKRTPIEDLIAAADTPPQRRRQLQLVQAIREFAAEVGLETDGHYRCFYDTGGRPVSWNISASPPDRLEPHLWHFPLVGALPYKGFFARRRAEAEYRRLVEEGFDVLLRPVSAYSTLGYFADPLLSTMLDDPPDELADLILHELTHATIFARDQADFNETLATFVGRRASLLFLARHFGADSPAIARARARREDADRFRRFMRGVVHSLDSLYALGLPRQQVLSRRRQIFAAAQQRFRATLPLYHSPTYRAFLDWQVNNARLLSYRRYHDRVDLFERIYRLEGEDLRAALAVFAACARAERAWTCLEEAASPPGGG